LISYNCVHQDLLFSFALGTTKAVTGEMRRGNPSQVILALNLTLFSLDSIASFFFILFFTG
jgi:hypothetical protein